MCPTPVILSVSLSISVYLLSTKPVPQSQKERRLICHAEDLIFAELKGGILFPKIQSYSLRTPDKLSCLCARKKAQDQQQKHHELPSC